MTNGQPNDIEQLDNELTHTRLSAESHIRESLRAELLARAANPASHGANRQEELETMIPIKQRSPLRTLLNTAAAILVLVTVIVAVPPLRSFAEEIITRIGDLVITDAPTYAERDPSEIEPVQIIDPAEVPDTVSRYISLTQIAEQTGMETYILPEPPLDFVFSTRQLIDGEIFDFITTHYTRVTTVTVGTDSDRGSHISLRQWRVEPDRERELPVGNADVREITVRGAEGVWIAGVNDTTIQDRNGDTVDVQQSNYLIWEENGYVLEIVSGALTLEQAQTIAADLVIGDPASEVDSFAYQPIWQAATWRTMPIYTPYIRDSSRSLRWPDFLRGYNPSNSAVEATAGRTIIQSYGFNTAPHAIYTLQTVEPEVAAGLTTDLDGETLSVRGTTATLVTNTALQIAPPAPPSMGLPDAALLPVEVAEGGYQLGFDPAAGNDVMAEGWSLLVWEEDGITFAVQANALDRNGLLQYVESLSPLMIATPQFGRTIAGDVTYLEQDAVEETVGFDLYTPVRLPEGTIRYGYAVVNDAPQPTAVMYIHADNDYLLYQRESPMEPDIRVGEPQPQPVTIRRDSGDITATFYAEAVIEVARPGRETPLLESWNILTWEIDGVYFLLQADDADLDTMLDFAESLAE